MPPSEDDIDNASYIYVGMFRIIYISSVICVYHLQGFVTNITVLDIVARSNHQLALKALTYSLCTEDLAVHPLNPFP